MIEFQRTLKGVVDVDGIGLHTGKRVRLAIRPAAPDTGILFRRTDLPNSPEVRATFENVVNCVHATTIGKGKCTISTIEHLMAAFAGLGIDNALVEIDGPEVPALDGSAAIFVMLIDQAGVVTQEEPRTFIEVVKEIEVKDGDKKVTLLPSKRFHVDFYIDFSHPIIKSQRFSSTIDQRTFRKKIAKARTFGFLREVDFLHKNGLALGASLENAVVLGEDRVMNDGGLRFSDEFVRHKVLDIMGDLYLLGAPIRARVRAEKSGHALHYKAIKELMSKPQAWRWSRPAIHALRATGAGQWQGSLATAGL